MFCKKDVLKHLLKFTEKHMCQSLYFNEVAGWRHATFFKRLRHRCLPVNFAQFLRISIPQNTCEYLLPTQHARKHPSYAWFFLVVFVLRLVLVDFCLNYPVQSRLQVSTNAGCVPPPSVCSWHAKKNITHAWIVYRWIVNRWIVYREIGQPYR